MEFTLKVTGDDVNVIGSALGKMPYENVANLIKRLRDQVLEQDKPETIEVKEPEVKED